MIQVCPHCKRKSLKETCDEPRCVAYFQALWPKIDRAAANRNISFDQALDVVIADERKAGRVA